MLSNLNVICKKYSVLLLSELRLIQYVFPGIILFQKLFDILDYSIKYKQRYLLEKAEMHSTGRSGEVMF